MRKGHWISNSNYVQKIVKKQPLVFGLFRTIFATNKQALTIKWQSMKSLDPKFIPMNQNDLDELGWDEIDILLVTGDAYVDHPSYGIAVIGRLLLKLGYRCGIVAQPDWKNPDCLKVMGRPRLACFVTEGNMDSSLSIYTVGRRYRKTDAYSPGGEIRKRPQHAAVVYTQLCKQAFSKIPVVIGGVGTSLRRFVHYDYWQDKLKPSVLVESKASILVYGMGEKAVTEITERLENGEPLAGIRGTATLLGKKAAEAFEHGNKYVVLPSFGAHKEDKDQLLESTKKIEFEMNPWCGRGLTQLHGDRMLVQEPPQEPLSTCQMDEVFDMPFAMKPHPSYDEKIPAYVTIEHSIPAVRGCPGGCTFCGLVAHQGKQISYRSEESIMGTVDQFLEDKNFRGTISDIGGAASNIYGNTVYDEDKCKKCRRTSCFYPKLCNNYNPDGKPLLSLLKKIKATDGVKHLHLNSGLRLALAVDDRQKELTKEVIHHHVSGHQKVAPEHLDKRVVALMRKDPPEDFFKYKKIFEEESKNANKEQYLIPLLISNFPGTTDDEMKVVGKYLDQENWSPQQVQDFIPLPLTIAGAMYYCGKDPKGNEIEVHRGLKERRGQIHELKRKRGKGGLTKRDFRRGHNQHRKDEVNKSNDSSSVSSGPNKKKRSNKRKAKNQTSD